MGVAQSCRDEERVREEKPLTEKKQGEEGIVVVGVDIWLGDNANSRMELNRVGVGNNDNAFVPPKESAVLGRKLDVPPRKAEKTMSSDLM